MVHEYARKVTELQLACEPLLLLVLARLEYGVVTQAAPPARSRQRSADSYAFLALFAHKCGIWHAPKASAADDASAAAASGAVGAVGAVGAGASGAIAAEGVGVNGDGGVNGHGGASLSVELGLTGRSVLTELELREIREADEARELELISDAQRQGEASSIAPILPSRSWSGALGPEARWQRKADETSSGDGDPTLPSSALDTLMALRGLHHVKNIALELHTRVMAERRLPPAMRVKTSLNFSLMGNPGTGKTTVAKLLGQLLHELGLRSSTTFVSTSGEAMLRECPKKIPGLIASADNGVLFIDEAYQLDPAKNSEGKAIVNQLLTAAEENRETLSIIFAGYKDDTEEKLYAYSCGLQSRFQWPQIANEDLGWPPSSGMASTRGSRAASVTSCLRTLRSPSSRRSLWNSPRSTSGPSTPTWPRSPPGASHDGAASRALPTRATCAHSDRLRLASITPIASDCLSLPWMATDDL